ncbi:serine-threonine/tyrosine-protein kinase catalytic domain-containing protein [Artemisia annua]|uniref:Serine-threonine/tyrosine-protein kinase catalytic domain-containing protein n=1 Tax=Artemisia annua TaxID=35608 RepID=A0A2U1M2I9_ARTAN|nr:serine-threonine/tyrosine-protein kinase catalytic domain-containing protein [Artemisia annua]
MAPTITEFDHLKIPVAKILEATNNFDDKNIIGEGGFGKVYKGKLLRSGKLINISARRLDRKHGQGDVEFWTEISALSELSVFKDNTSSNDFDASIVKMIGFCDENGEKIIITHYDIKGSLSMFLGDPTTFSLQYRLWACYVIVKAIRDIHGASERAFSFIHRNINSSTILLDDNWEAKLSGFEFSIKHSRDRKNFGIHSEVIGTQGYIDPTYLMTGSVTHKSDVYSLGVVLFEILCGRHAYNPNEQDDKKLLAPLAHNHYEKGTLHDIIHPELWNQLPSRNSNQKMVFEKLSKIAYSCLNKQREQRPDIDQVVYELRASVKSHPIIILSDVEVEDASFSTTVPVSSVVPAPAPGSLEDASVETEPPVVPTSSIPAPPVSPPVPTNLPGQFPVIRQGQPIPFGLPYQLHPNGGTPDAECPEIDTSFDWHSHSIMKLMEQIFRML